MVRTNGRYKGEGNGKCNARIYPVATKRSAFNMVCGLESGAVIAKIH